MNFSSLGSLSVIILLISAMTLLIGRDWRWIVLAIAAQYLGSFLLVAISWPLNLAVIKLVVGWMAGAALGISQIGQRQILVERSWPAGRLFRLLAAGLVIIVDFSLYPQAQNIFPTILPAILQGSLILISLGLLQLGMTGQPFRVIIGLLTLLAGFEILYSVMENSVLVAGLLAIINLGLVGVGLYFLSSFHPEELT